MIDEGFLFSLSGSLGMFFLYVFYYCMLHVTPVGFVQTNKQTSFPLYSSSTFALGREFGRMAAKDGEKGGRASG